MRRTIEHPAIEQLGRKGLTFQTFEQHKKAIERSISPTVSYQDQLENKNERRPSHSHKRSLSGDLNMHGSSVKMHKRSQSPLLQVNSLPTF